jgi:hypothetical protein
MLVVYALAVTSLFLICLYKWDSWKSEAEAERSDKLRVQDELAKTRGYLEFYKQTILALHERPIVVGLTDEQIHLIADRMAEKFQEPKTWMH